MMKENKRKSSSALALLLCVSMLLSGSLSGCEWNRQSEEPLDEAGEEAPEPTEGGEPQSNEIEAAPGDDTPVEGEGAEPERQEEPAAEDTSADAQASDELTADAAAPQSTPLIPDASPAAPQSSQAKGNTTTPPLNGTGQSQSGAQNTAPAAKDTTQQENTASGAQTQAPAQSESNGLQSAPAAQALENQPLSATTRSNPPAQTAAVAAVARPQARSGKSYSDVSFPKSGSYSEAKVYRNGTIKKSNVVLQNKTFTGNLTIPEGVGSGEIVLKNVEIQGDLIVKGGSGWVKLYDSDIGNLVTENRDSKAKVFAAKGTTVWGVDIKRSTTLEEASISSGADGFKNVTVNGSKGLDLTLKNMSLNKLKTSTSSNVIYDGDTIINYLYAYAPTELYGSGQVNRLFARSNGIYYDTLPRYVETSSKYAAPTRRRDDSSSGSSSGSKGSVRLYSIPDKYLDVGDNKVFMVDTNGTKLSVTNSNPDVAKVSFTNSYVRAIAKKKGTTTVRVTASRNGYTSKTISFDVVVGNGNSTSIRISDISDRYMDSGDTRYVDVNTTGSSIRVTNSDKNVAGVYVDGFQLKLTARNKGTTTVKVTASRSGYKSKTVSFKIHVDKDSSDSSGSSVRLYGIEDQSISRGTDRVINVDTNGTSIQASSNDTGIVRVSREGMAIRLTGVAPGSATVTVTASRRGYNDSKTSFRVRVSGNYVDAPTVRVRKANNESYTFGSWSNQDVLFYVDGYSLSRDLYVYERPAGTSSANWGNRKIVTSPYQISADSNKDYYFFTKGDGANSESTPIYTVRVDKTKPVIGAPTITGTTAVFTVSDATSGIKSVTADKGTLTSLGGGKWQLTYSVPGTSRVTVTDKAGNVETRDIAFQNQSGDTEKPVITGISVDPSAAQTSWTKETVTVKFKVLDNKGVKSVTVKNGSANVGVTSLGNNDYSFSATTSGTYIIGAADTSDNAADPKTVTLMIDQVKPVITALTSTVTSATEANVTVQVTEQESGIKGAEIVNVNDANDRPVWSNDKTFVGKLGQTYEIKVTDNAGNVSEPKQITLSGSNSSGSTTASITIPTNITVTPDAAKKTATVTFQVDAALEAGDALTVSVTGDGMPMSRSATQITQQNNTYSFQAAKNGTYTIHAKSKKLGEQTASVKVSELDETKPVITQTSSANGSLSFTVTDDGSGVDTVSYAPKLGGTAKTLSLSNGTYTITEAAGGSFIITAKDKAGNTATQEVTVSPAAARNDTAQAPEVKAAATTLNGAGKESAETLLTVDGKGAAVTGVTVAEQGAAVSKLSETQYQFSAKQNGTYTVTVTNSAGKTNTMKLQVSGIEQADKEAPKIAVGAKTPNSDLNQVAVSLTVTDNSKVASVKASSGTVTGSDGKYTLTAEANGAITITAEDDKGNSSTASVTISEIDTEAPKITAGTQKVSSSYSSATVELTVTDNGKVDTVTASTGTITGSDGKYLLTAAQNGTVTITAKDKKGNSSTATVTIAGIDTAAPSISAGTPTASGDYSSATVELTVAEPEKVDTVTASSGTVTGSNGKYTLTATKNETITVTAKAKNGASSTATVVIDVLDAEPPVITAESPALNDAHTSATVKVSASDSKSGMDALTVSAGAVLTGADGSYTLTTSQNGTYTLTAKDKKGNQATKQVTVSGIVKDVPPTIEKKDISVNGASAVQSLTVSDNGGSPIKDVTASAGTLTGSGSSYTLTMTQNGSYTVTVTNQAGKSASATIEVTQIDTVPPTLSGASASGSEGYKTATIQVTAADSGSGVASVLVNGSPAQAAGGGRYTYQVAQNGTYLITAKDNAGNVSQQLAVTVSEIDATAPVISYTPPAVKEWKQESTVSFSVSDSQSGISAAPTVTLDGNTVAVSGSNGSYSFKAAANGSYLVSAADQAGNQATKTITVSNIDRVKPAAPSLKDGTKTVPAQSTAYTASSTSLTVQFTAAAAGESPVKVMMKKSGSSSFTAVSGGKITVEAGKTITVELKTVDGAGNESAVVKYKLTGPKAAETPADSKDSKTDNKTEGKTETDKSGKDPQPSEEQPSPDTEEDSGDGTTGK